MFKLLLESNEWCRINFEALCMLLNMESCKLFILYRKEKPERIIFLDVIISRVYVTKILDSLGKNNRMVFNQIPMPYVLVPVFMWNKERQILDIGSKFHSVTPLYQSIIWHLRGNILDYVGRCYTCRKFFARMKTNHIYCSKYCSNKIYAKNYRSK